uniref:MSTP152 n=1 Tax=Homo sapiens TaxID=9606 RepID=Q7Z4C1_HUMAN|nr:MSTP152 [Homo sapiens]
MISLHHDHFFPGSAFTYESLLSSLSFLLLVSACHTQLHISLLGKILLDSQSLTPSPPLSNPPRQTPSLPVCRPPALSS